MRKLKQRERDEYIKIAKELGYPDKVIVRLYDAETEVQCERILSNARLEAC